MDPQITALVGVIDQAFAGPAWHGTPLWGSLRGMTAEQASRRPAPGRHNVWELVLHLAYWKYVMRRRFLKDGTLEFPRSPANWPAPPAVQTEAAWKADRALLKQEHEMLREIVVRFTAKDLPKRTWSSRWTNRQHIEGIASHDLYHGGQIQLVKRLTADG